MVRGALLALLAVGCSSSGTPPPIDLAVAIPDLSPPGCSLLFSGDVAGMNFCSYRFCHSETADSLQLYGGPVGFLQAVFGVDGAFMPGRTYGAAQLTAFDVSVNFDHTGSNNYVAGKAIAGSSVTLTFADIEPNGELSCATRNATALGTVRVDLIRQPDADAGMTAPSHVTMVGTF
jgi:hypothetical protein